MLDYIEIFEKLCDYYDGARPNRRGYVNAPCPFCGAESDRANPRFGFNHNGFHCFVCQRSGNLIELARHLNILEPGATPRPRPTPRVRPPDPEPDWLGQAEELIRAYETHPDRMRLWQGYKPLHEETIVMHRLGVGTLPGQREQRLIVPLFWDGQCVGFKARKLGNSGNSPKWISARGTRIKLYNVENITRGSIVWLCENYIDALLIGQAHPEDGTTWIGVASGGARVPHDDEIAAIAIRNPSLAIVIYDNDLPGQASGAHRARLEAQWRLDHPNAMPPKSAGAETSNRLRAAGLSAFLYPWPENAPAKADIEWVIQQKGSP